MVERDAVRRPIFCRRSFLQAAAGIAAVGAVDWRQLVRGAEQPAADLIVRTPDPLNAEPALAKLVAERVTPVKHFYVRNHGPTPKLAAGGFQLQIERLVQRPLSLS